MIRPWPGKNAPGSIPVDLPAPTLPPAVVPFPVFTPFRMRPDMFKLGASPYEPAESGPLALDDRFADYSAGKRALGASCGMPLLLDPHADAGGVVAALVAAICSMASAHPQWIRLEAAGSTRSIEFASSGLRILCEGGQRITAQALRAEAAELAGAVERLPDGPMRLGAALAWSIQEDFALMAGRPEGLVAEALSVAFPSGWDPLTKIGRSFEQIHGPVADGQALRTASANLSRAMVEKGPFVRYVWTLADTGALDQRPGLARVSDERSVAGGALAAATTAAPDGSDPAGGSSVDDIWFRCERQVTLPLAQHDRGLFLIRVYTAPLAVAAATPERRRLLAQALQSMAPEVIEYKNLERLRAVILKAWL